jgi:hypothetical protein
MVGIWKCGNMAAREIYSGSNLHVVFLLAPSGRSLETEFVTENPRFVCATTAS